MRLFERRDGRCVAELEPTESAVLREVFTEVVALLSDGFDRADPVIDRMFPDIYPDDPAAASDLHRYTDEELRSSKLSQARALLSGLPAGGGEVRLGDAQAEDWLRALTDARLALGLRLGISDDTDLVAEMDEAVLRDPVSARVGQLSVYEFLTCVQESLLAALTARPTW